MTQHKSATRPLPRREAELLAESIAAFSTRQPPRLLRSLLVGKRTVAELAAENELTQAATSSSWVPQDAKLVGVRRGGRCAFCALHDHHIPELLAAMRHHYEHRLG